MSAPSFLPLVDPTASTLVPALALIGPLLVPATLRDAVLPTLPKTASYIIDATSAKADDDLVLLLNDGASALVVSQAQFEHLMDVPRERLIVKIGESELSASAATLAERAAGLYITDAQANHTAKSLGLKDTRIYLSPAQLPSADALVELIRTSLPSIIVIPTASLTDRTSSAKYLSIADAFLAPVTSDRPDGLFPTIVSSSTHSSRPLGMVYSSRESVAEAIKTQKGVYQSRKHGLWRKGETSGSVQDLISIGLDCDSDALVFDVVQHGTGFCHLGTQTCFGQWTGLARLEETLKSRLQNAPAGSYTKRIFTDEKLLRAKIMEEAEELCDANTKDEVAFEAADLVYFALARAVSKGVSLKDIEVALDKKHLKVTRRKGDAKPKWEAAVKPAAAAAVAAPVASTSTPSNESIRMRAVTLSEVPQEDRRKLLLRPVLNSMAMIDKVKPIVERVRKEGDDGLKAMTKQFDKAELESNIQRAPFASPDSTQLPDDVRLAIDQAYKNVKAFHAAQVDAAPLRVETMPGVVCSRFARPIQRVGIYVPGGTAILPSTAIMLGVPAQVAGCKEIVLATPPRPDGSISPEVLYAAKLTGVTCILKAGGAQAVAALAYGTATVPKVDKIFGPGNQWVTAAKMLVQNDTDALVAIDMPAGPSEVLVIADETANPVFVASDLLSQAEHGVDSQVVLVGISLTPAHLEAIEAEVDKQARALPRVEIAREAIKKSLIVLTSSLEEALAFSNEYAPEHLILHLADAPGAVEYVENAGSVFVGAFSPESCGDYASGTNHTLPTNGYARQFSGVNTLSFQKHITSQEVTPEGLKVLGPVVVTIAEREGLEAHANAVRVRLRELGIASEPK